MAHWKYLPMIATINKGLLNKKMSLSIIVVLRQNFLNTFIKIAILGKIYQCSNCCAKWDNIGSNVYVSTATLLLTFLITKKSGLSSSAHFYKNSLIVPCCTFGRFEIRTLTSNRLKNQTNDSWNYLATITIINEGFLNKNLWLSIAAVLT